MCPTLRQHYYLVISYRNRRCYFMYSAEDITNYRCPRWNEFPDIDLYMDQVVSLIDKHTAVFAENDEEVILTRTMINNYVKQKKIDPPKNKRYNKKHLAYFLVVGLLKKFMSLSEISEGISIVRERHSTEEAYDLFCEVFEGSIKAVFLGIEGESFTSMRRDIALMHAVTLSYAHMLYARYLISMHKAQGNDDTQTL